MKSFFFDVCCLYARICTVGWNRNKCIAYCIFLWSSLSLWEILVLKSHSTPLPTIPFLWNELFESSYGWKTLFVRVSGAVYSSKLDNLGLNTIYSFPFMTRLCILKYTNVYICSIFCVYVHTFQALFIALHVHGFIMLFSFNLFIEHKASL